MADISGRTPHDDGQLLPRRWRLGLVERVLRQAWHLAVGGFVWPAAAGGVRQHTDDGADHADYTTEAESWRGGGLAGAENACGLLAHDAVHDSLRDCGRGD